MRYTNSHLEDWIEQLYREINITKPHEINFDRIAQALDILIVYNPETSFALRFNGMYTISLDSRKTRQEQWLDFAHEDRFHEAGMILSSFMCLKSSTKPIILRITFVYLLSCSEQWTSPVIYTTQFKSLPMPSRFQSHLR